MLDTRTVNKIVIVGNGFDLANELKTSYVDFVLWYLNECYTQNNKKKIYTDRLITFFDKSFNEANPDLLFNKIEDIKTFIETCKVSNGIVTSKYYTISSFLYKIIHEIKNKNWTDIETLYFNIIEDEVKDYMKYDNPINESFLKKINLDLEYLTTLLIQYLKTDKCVLKKIDLEQSAKFNDIFCSKSKSNDTSTLFINFNYTSTIEHFKELMSGESIILNIHGSLSEFNNPIIFGYGDETNKYYKEIEHINSFELMKNFKSFWYSKTNNYSTLLGFLESGKFDVFILGHSCGLSDRVMLKTIFEHKLCRYIHALHYGHTKEEKMNNHFKTIVQISRHFDDKIKMRERVQHFDEDMCLPIRKI